jgi:hypothetical protein
MKKLFVFFNSVIIICLIIISCEPENKILPVDPEFSIKFSDGTMINEKDIVFYDSSTCNLFLKNKLRFNYVFVDKTNIDFLDFSVFVGKDTVYQGVVYPEFVAGLPPKPYYIAGYTIPDFDSDFISLRHMGLNENLADLRNSPVVINSFKKSDLLHQGITCVIDSIYASGINDSAVICVFTLKNPDNTNYYIPDPNKMGIGRFCFYIGGLSMNRKDTNKQIQHNYPFSQEWEDLSLNDLSLLKSNSTLTFTYETELISRLEKGTFDCRFYYCLLNGFGTWPMELAQTDGRVWIGNFYLKINNVIIEK